MTARQGRTGPVAAKDLERGDIVHEYLSDDDEAKREYAEVRHVEPVTGRNEMLVVFAGGATAEWAVDAQIRLADPDEYEQHLAAIRDEQNRTTLLVRLRHLVALIANGAPVPERVEVRLSGMRSPEAVRELAEMLGVEAVDDDGGYAFTTRMSYEPERYGGFEVTASYYRNKTADERKAWEEREAAEQAEPDGGEPE